MAKRVIFAGQPRWLPPLVGGLAAVLAAGVVPVFAQREGMRFMPAPGYVAALEVPVALAALLLSLALLGVFTLLKPPGQRLGMWRRPVQALPGLFAVLIFFAFPLYMVVLVTLPMALASAGGDMVAEYRVRNDNPRLRGKRLDCYPAVSLAGMPLLYNRACHLPEAVQKALEPGDAILLEGRGNLFGIHYRNARRG